MSFSWFTNHQVVIYLRKPWDTTHDSMTCLERQKHREQLSSYCRETVPIIGGKGIFFFLVYLMVVIIQIYAFIKTQTLYFKKLILL